MALLEISSFFSPDRTTFNATCNIHDVKVTFRAQASAFTEEFLKERVGYLGEQISLNPRAVELCKHVYAQSNVQILFNDLGKKSRARWFRDHKVIMLDPNYEKTVNLRSLIFEWCNATNIELNKLSYADFDDSFIYAEELEKAEWNTLLRAHKIITEGIHAYGWQLKDVALPRLGDQKLRSVVYNGYSHYLLNVKFHNDDRISLLQKRVLDDKGKQELQNRKLLALTMEFEAKKDFPTKVIEAIYQQKHIDPVAFVKYTEELAKINEWFSLEERKITQGH